MSLEALWVRAEDVDRELQKQQAESKKLYDERCRVQSVPTPSWRIEEIETKYWTIEGSIVSLEALRATLLEAIERLERGGEIKNLDVLLGNEENRAEQKLSKRRLAMQRDQEFKPRDDDFMFDRFFLLYSSDFAPTNVRHGIPETRLMSTGRRAKRVKGNFTGPFAASEAAAAFFTATVDTHGGKSRRGAKYQEGAAYLTKGGKAIRKR